MIITSYTTRPLLLALALPPRARATSAHRLPAHTPDKHHDIDNDNEEKVQN